MSCEFVDAFFFTLWQENNFIRKINFYSSMPARNADQEREILTWMEAVMGEKLPAGDFEDVSTFPISLFKTIFKSRNLIFLQVLKDGVVLCKLMNKIKPDSIKKFKTSGPAFLLMENINSFQVIVTTVLVRNLVRAPLHNSPKRN